MLSDTIPEGTTVGFECSGTSVTPDRLAGPSCWTSSIRQCSDTGDELADAGEDRDETGTKAMNETTVCAGRGATFGEMGTGGCRRASISVFRTIGLQFEALGASSSSSSVIEVDPRRYRPRCNSARE